MMNFDEKKSEMKTENNHETEKWLYVHFKKRRYNILLKRGL